MFVPKPTSQKVYSSGDWDVAGSGNYESSHLSDGETLLTEHSLV